MEYSLQTLNENSTLKSLQTSKIIETLNLIGFEVDGVIKEPFITNSFLENIRFIIKIPANREDLLNEKLFLIELSSIFLLELCNHWEKIKKNYDFILHNQYQKYLDYESQEITSTISDVLILQIPINVESNFCSPLWIQNKLLNGGLPITKKIEDLLTLNTLEWGQTFNCFIHENNKSEEKLLPSENLFFPFSLEKLVSSETFLNQILPAETIVLKNKQGQIQTVLGLTPSIKFSVNDNNETVLQSVFYDIYENPLFLNTLETKFSLRHLRKIYLEHIRFSFQRLLTIFEITGAAKIIPKLYSIIPTKMELKNQKLLILKKNLLTSTLNLKQIDLTIFKKASLKVNKETENQLSFLIPNVRKDLEREIDLIEEYSRFIGYQNFVPIFPIKVKQYFQPKNNNIQFIKQILLSYGFQEVITNPLQDIKKQETNSIGLKNPLNNEFSLLRTNLLQKIIPVFENNLRLGIYNTSFFEIGRIFSFQNNGYQEKEKLSGIFQLKRIKKSLIPTIEWFMARGMIESFLSMFGFTNISFQPFERSLKGNFFHPKKSIEIKIKNNIIGYFGEIDPNIENIKNIKYPCYIFEFDLEFFKVDFMKSNIPIFQEERSKYQTVFKDLSFIVEKNCNFDDLKQCFEKYQKISTGPFKESNIFDIYFDENSQKEVGIGIRLSFQSETESLTTELIENELNQIKRLLQENFNAIFKT